MSAHAHAATWSRCRVGVIYGRVENLFDQGEALSSHTGEMSKHSTQARLDCNSIGAHSFLKDCHLVSGSAVRGGSACNRQATIKYEARSRWRRRSPRSQCRCSAACQAWRGDRGAERGSFDVLGRAATGPPPRGSSVQYSTRSGKLSGRDDPRTIPCRSAPRPARHR
jgi:hypothetical protein